MCRLSWNLGASTSWNPQGLSRPVMGLLYLYMFFPSYSPLYMNPNIIWWRIIAKALVSQISPSFCFFLSRLSSLSPSVFCSKTSPFCTVPPGSWFPLFKRGFLLLSWNRFPGVQTILFTGALGLVYCFHGNLYTSFAYKTLRMVTVMEVTRTWPLEFADVTTDMYISGYIIHD